MGGGRVGDGDVHSLPFGDDWFDGLRAGFEGGDEETAVG